MVLAGVIALAVSTTLTAMSARPVAAVQSKADAGEPVGRVVSGRTGTHSSTNDLTM